MSQQGIVTYSTPGTIQADTAASPNSLAMRDSGGGFSVAQLLAADLRTSGKFTSSSVTRASSFTVDDSVVLYLCDATSGALVPTLPAAAAVPGRIYTFKRTSSSNNVTVTRAGSDTIDGANTYVLSAQWKYVTLQSDGVASWLIIANN